MFGAEAKLAAQRLLEADLRGFAGDGLHTVPAILEAMDLGHIDPRAQLVVLKETAAICVLDGGQGLGQVAATKALGRAVQKAREVGTGTVVIQRGHTIGPAALYAALAADEGLIGMCTTNSGGATVVGDSDGVAWNTVTSICWGFPRAQGAPVLVDQPSARGHWGEVALAQQAGQTLSTCVAVDAEGQSTDQPDEARLLLPWAGPAGVATGLVSSMLSGILPGGRLPIHKKRAAERDGAEHFFYVIDPQQFGDAEAMQAELESGIEQWAAVPGQQQWQLAADRLENGIPVSEADSAALAQTARRLRVDWPE